jgi:hypothetical protein
MASKMISVPIQSNKSTIKYSVHTNNNSYNYNYGYSNNQGLKMQA